MKMYYNYCLDNILIIGLILISILTLTIHDVDACWGSASTNIGVMTPDQKLLNGSRLAIDCTLDNNTIEYNKTIYEVNSSMISFKFQNEYYREDRIHTISPTIARLVVDKASVDDNGMYFCLLNISGLDHHPLVCVSHVTVGHKPQSVTNFKCISLHYRKLHCSWTPPFNPIHTTYTLEDRIHASLAEDYQAYRNCGYVPSENSCEWTTDTIPPYRNTALKFNLVLIGQNQFASNRELYVVDHYSIIKPNIPKNLMVLEVTTSDISLSWKAPDYIEYDEDLVENIIYEIRYFSKNGQNSNNEDRSRTVIIDGIRNTSLILKNLIPFIRYNISIRCKTIQSKSDEYWSDFSSVLVTTKPDVPYLAPVLIPESFQTDKNMEGMRSITLFWKHIPEQYRNGRDFHYEIEFREQLNRKSRAINHLDKGVKDVITSQNTTYTFNHMKSNVAYLFKIYGVNAQGVSRNYSQIIVEQNDIIPHKPSNIDVYSFGGGRYEVKWVEPRLNVLNGQIVNYTVFWCQNLRPRPFLCEGAIDWIGTNNKSIALELPDIPTNYQFAVSANSLKASSGMSWAECIVPIDGRLDKLSEVHLKVDNSTSITIHWKLNCPALKLVVEGYKIKFCKTVLNICTKPEYVKAENSAENYTLNGLQPFSQYMVTVLAFSDSGPSEESDPIYATTFHDSPEDAPSALALTDKTDKSVSLSWKSPLRPNGRISYYEILCNNKSYTQSIDNCDANSCLKTVDKLNCYQKLQIQVRACNTKSLCSPLTKPLTTQTQVCNPEPMDPPRSEIINSTSVRISWSHPTRPNGPIDYHLLKLIRTDNTSKIYNISGKQMEFDLSLECDSATDDSTAYEQQYSVRISSVNMGSNGTQLMAEYSESANLNACLFADHSFRYVIAIIAGAALGLMALVFVLVILVRWMKRKIAQRPRIELPIGLEAPQLFTDSYDRDGEPFSPFARTDSIPNIPSGMIIPVLDDDDSFKNRHGSGLSHTSNSSVEALIYRNSPNPGNDLFRMASSDSGQHESIASHNSGGEAHMSSDSGVEIDNQHLNSEPNDLKRVNKISPKPSLQIIDERKSDSSGSRDSGINSGAVRRKRKPKPKTLNKGINKISSVIMPTSNEAVNPLYDTPLGHSVCVYSLLANSEPSLFELPVREDENILSDLTKFTKPEMAKSLSNIIQSCSPSESKVNCIICDTNNGSSRSSSRTASPNCPYYKYGSKRQNHIPSHLTNFSPEKQNKVKKTNNGYITIDSIPETGPIVPPKPLKKRLEHDWSQNSYDAEVSSTSSNGDNEQTQDMTQNHLFTQSCVDFSECEKIQNINSLVDIHDSTELNVITGDSFVNSLNETLNNNLSKPNVESCETPLNGIEESVKTSNNSTPVKRSLPKDSNGYVLHKSLHQMSPTSNPNKPNLIRNGNGYVVIDTIGNGIQMNDLVPNNHSVTHVTQV